MYISGGSAFGLDAAGGVMEFLEERGRGFDVTITRVPIVPTAVIYDLSVGNCRMRPDKAMGYAACQAARPEAQGDGSIGAGVGASVGKLLGIHQAMKGGRLTPVLGEHDGRIARQITEPRPAHRYPAAYRLAADTACLLAEPDQRWLATALVAEDLGTLLGNQRGAAALPGTSFAPGA